MGKTGLLASIVDITTFVAGVSPVMWPWEHAIVGYVAYSLFCHLYYRDSPGGLEAGAVVVAAGLPDLIDKPLAGEFGVFESGYALGHSIFFAIPLAIVVGLLTRWRGRPRTGIAFGVGYLLHLPADVYYPPLRGGSPQYDIVLWPIVTGESGGHEHGAFLDRFWALFEGYQAELFSSDPSLYVLAQLPVGLFAFTLWLYDGAPIARELLAGGKRLLTGRKAAERDPGEGT